MEVRGDNWGVPKKTSLPWLRRAVKFAGSQTKLAAMLGVSRPLISACLSTKRSEEITYRLALRIEQVTKGEISREKLRPDIFL
jgi:DNA-binding transcriptional regulator YdaS (Cro superfamily)